MVWADSGTVLNKNEAYAFASCTDCRATAISFQVILIIGQPSAAETQQLDALWREIQAFSTQTASLSYAEIYSRLIAFERQIVDIVKQYSAPTTTTPTTTISPSAPAVPGATDSAAPGNSILPSAPPDSGSAGAASSSSP